MRGWRSVEASADVVDRPAGPCAAGGAFSLSAVDSSVWMPSIFWDWADDPKPRPALRPVCLRPAKAQAAAVRCAAGRPSARHHRQAERVVQAIVPVVSVPGLEAWTLCARTTPGRKNPACVAPVRVFGD